MYMGWNKLHRTHSCVSDTEEIHSSDSGCYGYCHPPVHAYHYIKNLFGVLRNQFVEPILREESMGGRASVSGKQSLSRIFGTPTTPRNIKFTVLVRAMAYRYTPTWLPQCHVCPYAEETVLPAFIFSLCTYWVTLLLCWDMTEKDRWEDPPMSCTQRKLKLGPQDWYECTFR